MRVLVVSAWDPSHTTEGGSLILANSLPHWMRRHEVRVITAAREAGEASAAVVQGSRRASILAYGRSTTAPLDYAGRRAWSLATREPAHVRWVLRPKLRTAVRAAIGSGWPEVIHLLGWGTAPLWQLAAGLPTVHMPIDPWSIGLSNRRLPRWRAWGEAGVARSVQRHERRHYPRLGRVVVVAPHDAESLAKSVPEARIEVVTNGVDAGAEPGPLTPEPVFAFHGAFEAEANVDAARVLVHEVLPRVKREVPVARLLLIGRDPPPELCRLRSSSVIVTGAVADVREHLRRAAVHVDPMFSGTGLKNKVLEAMAAGLPVVASPLALSGIGAGDGTILAGSPAQIAEHVVRLLTNHEQAVKEGAAARARVLRDFSWERSASDVERLWHAVA